MSVSHIVSEPLESSSDMVGTVTTLEHRILPSQSLLKISNPDLLTFQKPKDGKMASVLIQQQPKEDKLVSLLIPHRPEDDTILITQQPKDDKILSLLIPQQSKEDATLSVLSPEQKTQKADPVFKPPIPVSTEAGTSIKSIKVQKTLSSFNTTIPLTPGFPGLIKIAPKTILPKPKQGAIIPRTVSVCGKHTIAYLGAGTLIRSDAVTIVDKPQLLIPTASQSTPKSSSLLISSLPKKPPTTSTASSPLVPLGSDTTVISKPIQKLTSVLLPGNNLVKKGGANKYINLKITNGKIIPPGQASFKFIREGAPIGSSLGKTLLPPTKLSVKSPNRLMPKFTALNPVIDALDNQSPTVKKMNLNNAAKEIKIEDVTTTEPPTNLDLNRCLQEAVDSMFSPDSPNTPDSLKALQDNEVTLIKVPLLPDTTVTIVQDRTSSEEIPDDVRIELVKPHVEMTTVSSVKPLKEEISLRFSDILKSQLLSKTDETENQQEEFPTGVTVELAKQNKVEPFAPIEMTVVLTKPDRITRIVETVASVDSAPVASTPDSKTEVEELCATVDKEVVVVKSEPVVNFEVEEPVATVGEEVTATTPEPVCNTDEMEQVVSVEERTEGATRRHEAKDFLTWVNGVGTLPYSKIRFKLNEFGLVELLDTEKDKKDEKDGVDLKHSDDDKDNNGALELKEEDEKPREKPKIGILEKGHSILKPYVKSGVEKLKPSLLRKPGAITKSAGYKSDENVLSLQGLIKKDGKRKKIKKKIKSPITKTEVGTECVDKPIVEEGSKSNTDEIFHCEGCGCYGLDVEFLNSRFCSHGCEADWTLKMEIKRRKEQERLQLKRKRKEKRILQAMQQKLELQNLQELAERELEVAESELKLALQRDPVLPESEAEAVPEVKSESKSPEPEPEPESQSESEPLPTPPVEMTHTPNITPKEETSNDGSQDSNSSKSRLPWQTGKHGFSWTKYLEFNKAKPAPVKLFKDPFPYSKNNFKFGMKMEGIDPKHPNHFCILTVADVYGFRVKLHFDGYKSVYDFWVNADSMDIFAAGWCERNGHTLHPPPKYNESNFNWNDYLKYSRGQLAPKNLFYNRTSDNICPNGFRIGMKLEAVDRYNTSLVCVATVAGLMDSRIMVHFDGWDDMYNYWADPSSSYIHPVGWCEEHGHKLTPPSDWPPSTFSWDQYLQITKSTAAPARAFKQRSGSGFRRGMKLECVDKRVPALVRVATVDDLREHQIRVKFDGWSDIYSYWVDEDSRDIHPMGWCQAVGHVLEPPYTSDDYLVDCPTKDCHGQGHVMGSKHMANHTVPSCPFDPQNLIKQDDLPDRLSSVPENSTEDICDIEKRLCEPVKNPIGRPPKWRRLSLDEKVAVPSGVTELQEISEFGERKRKKRTLTKQTRPYCKKKDIELLRQEIHQAVINPGYKPCGTEGPAAWAKHSQPLNVYINLAPTDCDVQSWSLDHVAKFVSSIPDCQALVDKFEEMDIDGEALFMMTQNDFIKYMGCKVGPAVKMYNCVLLLRQKIEQN